MAMQSNIQGIVRLIAFSVPIWRRIESRHSGSSASQARRAACSAREKKNDGSVTPSSGMTVRSAGTGGGLNDPWAAAGAATKSDESIITAKYNCQQVPR